MTERVSVYIDGFNLYYGLKSKGWRRYYWLDLPGLSEKLLRPGQQLATVRYFTARVLPRPGDPGQAERQGIYLDALETLAGLNLHYGHFLPKDVTCPRCGTTRTTYEEKMTDVNIATELMGDAQDDVFDVAIIISADSDLSGPISAIRQRYPDKQVIVAFPPNRTSIRLREVATAYFTIGRRRFHSSQLPPFVVMPDGYVLNKPPQWS